MEGQLQSVTRAIASNDLSDRQSEAKASIGGGPACPTSCNTLTNSQERAGEGYHLRGGQRRQSAGHTTLPYIQRGQIPSNSQLWAGGRVAWPLVPRLQVHACHLCSCSRLYPPKFRGQKVRLMSRFLQRSRPKLMCSFVRSSECT
jgi:hypothetical protein